MNEEDQGADVQASLHAVWFEKQVPRLLFMSIRMESPVNPAFPDLRRRPPIQLILLGGGFTSRIGSFGNT